MEDPTPIVDAPSKPRQRFRRTRIAVSLFFGVLAMVLCVLWGLSYKWMVGLSRSGSDNSSICLFSMNGAVRLNRLVVPRAFPVIPGWTPSFQRAEVEQWPRERWELRPWQKGFLSSVPHWFLILVTAAMSAVTRMQLEHYHLPSRFSLRTMLIATTLLAVVLGLVCYIVR